MAVVEPMNRVERMTWIENARSESKKRARNAPLAAWDRRSGCMRCGNDSFTAHITWTIHVPFEIQQIE